MISWLTSHSPYMIGTGNQGAQDLASYAALLSGVGFVANIIRFVFVIALMEPYTPARGRLIFVRTMASATVLGISGGVYAIAYHDIGSNGSASFVAIALLGFHVLVILADSIRKRGTISINTAAIIAFDLSIGFYIAAATHGNFIVHLLFVMSFAPISNMLLWLAILIFGCNVAYRYSAYPKLDLVTRYIHMM